MARKWRWLAISFVLFIGLLAGLLVVVKLKLPEIIDYSVKGVLQDYGLDVFESGDVYLGLKGAGSKKLFFSGHYKNIDYAFTLGNVQTNYQLAALFNGEIKQLSFDEIVAEISLKPAQTTRSENPVDLLALQQSIAAFQLPMEHIDIDALAITLDYQGASYQFGGSQLMLDSAAQSFAGNLFVESETPFAGDIKRVDIQLQNADALPWLPNLALSVNSETLSGLKVNLHWQQAGDAQSFAAGLSGSFRLNNIREFIASLGVELPAEVVAKPLPETALNTAFSGTVLLPKQLLLQDQQWLIASDFRGKTSGQFAVSKPKGGAQNIAFSAAVASPADKKQWQANGSIVVEELQANADWQADYQPGGEMRLASTIKLDDLPSLIQGAKDFDIQLPELQLAAGSAAVDLLFSNGATSQTNLQLSATGLSGLYQNIAFKSVKLSAPLVKTHSWRSVTAIEISAQLISAGVSLDNLNASLQLKNSPDFQKTHWQLEHFKAGLFSGQISLASSTDFEIPFSGNTFPIVLSNIQLDKMLGLYAQQGVSGTGVLNGLIPITLAEDGVKIEQGQLLNGEPGKINYHTDAASTVGNEQLAMTLRLLEDFNYEKLKVDLNFDPSGKLLFRSQLTGKNPAEFDGRQVNFNINLEENLYDLFKVLKLTDQLTRELEERLKNSDR